VSPGGGALLRAKAAVQKLKGENPDLRAGINIVLCALEAPVRQSWLGKVGQRDRTALEPIMLGAFRPGGRRRLWPALGIIAGVGTLGMLLLWGL
jgi:hypothetical protein